jgi:Flp pilus assembly protein TadG
VRKNSLTLIKNGFFNVLCQGDALSQVRNANMFKGLWKSFLKSSSGNVALAFGLMFVPMALAVGVAVDMSNANYVKANLQAAADAAALAGGADSRLSNSQLQTLVEVYARANGAEAVVASIKKMDGKPDPKDGTFTVNIVGRMETSLMGLVGIDDIDVSVSSVVSAGSRALEMALVLDVTGSMNGGMPSGGTRLASLQRAAGNMVTILNNEKSSYSILKVAVVPFSEYVNVGGGCVGSRAEPADADATDTGSYPDATAANCPPPVLALTDDLDKVRSKINSLTPVGATYVPAGVLWGWNALTDTAPMTEGMNKAEMRRTGGSKSMVIMTDGANTMEAQPDGSHLRVSPAPNADLKLAEVCANAKADDITVYTVTFMVTNPAIQTVMNGCASSATNTFDADNDAQLTAAFTTIGKKLANLRLQK